jgi:hypothetical protein
VVCGHWPQHGYRGAGKTKPTDPPVHLLNPRPTNHQPAATSGLFFLPFLFVFLFVSYRCKSVSVSMSTRGGVKTKMAKATYTCRSPKNKAVLFCFFFCFSLFYRVFGRFVARGVQKHEGKKTLFSPPPTYCPFHWKSQLPAAQERIYLSNFAGQSCTASGCGWRRGHGAITTDRISSQNRQDHRNRDFLRLVRPGRFLPSALRSVATWPLNKNNRICSKANTTAPAS